ncbi:MAG: DNA-3-methyladenine glycosylase, partial [Chloroflexi bacterium]|nr:DNA-3-methyladenine glycosylase [Chloroflexota bacterium]
PMYGPAGRAYVYLVYGMHHCLNVVAETDRRPGAVLIRALEPVAGVSAMRVVRPAAGAADARLLAGPGLLCAGMSIDRHFDGHDLTFAGPLWIADDPVPDEFQSAAVVTGPRIGVAYAGPVWAARPWRFGRAGSASLSRPFPAQARATDPTT